jgi:MarR family transcriptional regulator for hemolysin
MQVRNANELKVLSTPGHLISLAARSFARLSEARLKPLGFGVGYLPVLVALKNGVATTQRDLARFAKMEQPSMAQMLARLERDGLIKREPDPGDGRSSLISLTSLAEARMPGACEVLYAGNREATGCFTAAEAIQFISLLKRLTANLESIVGAETAK